MTKMKQQLPTTLTYHSMLATTKVKHYGWCVCDKGSCGQLGPAQWVLRTECCQVSTKSHPPHTNKIHFLLRRITVHSTSMMRLSDIYLFFYNSLQAFGWAIALFRISVDFLSTKSVNGGYASAGQLICLLQSLAFIEVIHGALGIVPSGFIFPLMQWGGRTHFLLAIVCQIHEVQELPAVLITFVAWCCIEIIRYPFYALSCLGNCPSFLTYIRYTAFIVIYPIGVVGEMWIMYQSLPVIKEKKLYADYFAAFPFSYYTFVKAVLICYPFLWLQLYCYLFKQRRSKLYPRSAKDKKRK